MKSLGYEIWDKSHDKKLNIADVLDDVSYLNERVHKPSTENCEL